MFWVPQSDLLHHLSLRQGTHVLHVPNQTHLALVTVSNEIVHPMPVVVLVGLIGLPPGTEGRFQGRSRLAPFAWPSHSYLDEEVCGQLDANHEISP